MSANEKDEWKISTENRLQIFPQGSSQIYLTRPTKIFPKEALKFKTVSTPPDKYCDVLSKYGIRTAAMAEYKKYYYISRGTGTDAYTVCFYIGATNYRARFSDKIYSVKANDVLLIPVNSPATLPRTGRKPYGLNCRTRHFGKRCWAIIRFVKARKILPISRFWRICTAARFIRQGLHFRICRLLPDLSSIAYAGSSIRSDCPRTISCRIFSAKLKNQYPKIGH